MNRYNCHELYRNVQSVYAVHYITAYISIISLNIIQDITAYLSSTSLVTMSLYSMVAQPTQKVDDFSFIWGQPPVSARVAVVLAVCVSCFVCTACVTRIVYLQMNDGPVCLCKARSRQSGIRHGYYAGEQPLPPCQPHSNNAHRLHHYRVTIAPSTNFLVRLLALQAV